jgi:Ni,Fe-hydrogenase maturation factor
MNKTVYVLGNPLIKSDNLPLMILPALIKTFPKIKFEILDPTESLVLNKKQDLVFIDTVLGIKKVTVFDNLEKFMLSPRVSVHDFDLFLELALLFKMKKIKKIKIIGLPQKGKKREMLFDVCTQLSTHFVFKK